MQENNKIIEHAIKILNESNLSSYKIGQDTGITQASIGNWRNGKTKPTLANAKIIVQYLTDCKTYLSEEMGQYGNHAITTEEELTEAQNKGLKLLPEVNFKFSAGQTQLISGREDITRYWYLPDCKDCEGVAQVVGNSMQPTFPAGCYVALKRYSIPTENPNLIPFGNVFGIVVEDKMTGEYHGHIKILRRYKDQSLASKYWIAHSINDAEFDDFDIEIAQVRSLWVVKQHIVNDML